MRNWRLLAVAGALVLAAFAPASDPQAGVTVQIAVGKNMADRMPTDTGSVFGADVGSLVAWTMVTGGAGQKLTHTWTHGPHSDVIALNIGGSPWRTYSRKTIPAEWTGEWKVEVKDSTGTVLATKTFTVGK